MTNYRFLPVHKFSVAHMSSFLMLLCQKKTEVFPIFTFILQYFLFLFPSFFTPPYLLFFYFISSSLFSYI